jgi:hypothetical protein
MGGIIPVKWFKHLTGSLNNSIISQAIEQFGGDGYLVFFGILEMMADEFDSYNPGKITLRMKKVRRNLQLSRQKTVKILRFFDQKAKEKLEKNQSFFVEIEGDEIRLNCPKLKELCDEYTRKELTKVSGVSQELVRSKSGVRHRQQKQKQITTVFTGGTDAGFLNVGGTFLDEIIIKCQKIQILQGESRGDKKINIAAWVNQAVQEGAHPKAIDYSIEQLIIKWNNVGQPWPYVESIFQMKNGNFWEEEYIQESEKFKIEWESISDKIKGLVEQINNGGDQE